MHHHEEHGHHHCRHHDDEGEEGGHCGCEHHGGHRHEHGEGGQGCGCEHGRECCCGRGPHHAGGHHGPCAGGPGRHFRRHFYTREERLARLEEYLKDLQAEVKAVEELMAALKASE